MQTQVIFLFLTVAMVTVEIGNSEVIRKLVKRDVWNLRHQKGMPQELRDLKEKFEDLMDKTSGGFDVVEKEVIKRNETFIKKLVKENEEHRSSVKVKKTKKKGKPQKDKTNEQCMQREIKQITLYFDANMETTIECVAENAKVGMKVVENARKAYKENSYWSNEEGGAIMLKLKECMSSKINITCVRETIPQIKERVETTQKASDEQLAVVREVVKNQYDANNYCLEEYHEELKKVQEQYATAKKRCES